MCLDLSNYFSKRIKFSYSIHIDQDTIYLFLFSHQTVPVSNTQYDDGRFEIAWRDDGLYFAVSWIDPLTENRRRIRVYNDTGELFSTTELTNMISPGLCWR